MALFCLVLDSTIEGVQEALTIASEGMVQQECG